MSRKAYASKELELEQHKMIVLKVGNVMIRLSRRVCAENTRDHWNAARNDEGPQPRKHTRRVAVPKSSSRT
jgi:hypothetical protein